MNNYDFTQPGGFPFDQGVMKFIQDCIGTAAQTAALAGPLSVLSGCVEAGSNVGNGVVVINGEILPFVGGVKQSKVIIQQDAAPVVFQDNQPRVVKYTRTARFGDDGTTAMLWANFKRNTNEGVLARLDRVEGLLRPFSGSGGMVWWKGTIASIPVGWREVAEWRGKFPMAAKAPVAGVRPDGFDIGNEGGSETITIERTNLPNVKLKTGIFTNSQDYVDGTAIPKNNIGTGANDEPMYTEALGDGAPIEFLPEYKTGCWIEPIPGTF